MDSLKQTDKFLQRWTELVDDYNYTAVSILQVFVKICCYPELTTGELTDKLKTSQPTMYRSLKKLEKMGLGHKVQDTFDPRAYNFSLSSKGKELKKLIDC